MSFEDFRLIQKDRWTLDDLRLPPPPACFEDHDGLIFIFADRNIWWKDLQGVYRGCSVGLMNVIGLEFSHEIIGKTDFELPWSEEASEFRKCDRLIQETGFPMHGRKELVRVKNGTLRVFLVSKAPLTDSEGNFIGTVGNAVDITTTQELGKALIKSQYSEKRASVAKQNFMANMSHDLLTPITGLLGLIQSLEKKQKGIASHLLEAEQGSHRAVVEGLLSDAKKDTKMMEETTNGLLSLFQEILDVTRIDSDVQDITKHEEPFDLVDLVERQRTLMLSSAKAKGLDIVINIHDSLPPLFFGARLYVERIVANLLSNAVRFTEQGSVSVDITPYRVDKTECRIKIVMTDTGLGIPSEKFDDIFEPFLKLTPSAEGKQGGIGNGLYAVKRYVDAMSGAINFDSTEGHGTRFKVIFPLSIPSTSVIKIQPKKPKEKKREAPYSILVVEDNFLAAKAVEHLLCDLGCVVSVANTGSKAMDMASTGDYDLILMDVGLPDADGLVVSNRIRKISDKKKASVPIVVLSGHIKELSLSSDAESAMIRTYLEKPARREQLQNILNTL